MPVQSYASIVEQISINAKTAMFFGQNDKNSIAQKFGKTFGAMFADAVLLYIKTCIGLPIGGPITAASTSKLEIDIYQAGKQAFIATFQNESDINDIAEKFGQELKPIAASIATWIATCSTIPAAPPAVPLSPGGPIIITGSDSIQPVMLQCFTAAIIATYQGQADWPGTNIFASIMSTIAPTISAYAAETISLPGGGPLQLS